MAAGNSDFEAVVNGRDVIVMPDGPLDGLTICVVDAETQEEVELSREDETRLWGEAYEREIDSLCAYADGMDD